MKLAYEYRGIAIYRGVERMADESPWYCRDMPPGLGKNGKTKWRKRARLAKAQRGRCLICGKPVEAGEASLHHFIPRVMALADENRSTIVNVALAHIDCNNRWGRRVPTALHWWRFFWLHVRLGHVQWPWQRQGWTIKAGRRRGVSK